jgi:PQQ-like domain
MTDPPNESDEGDSAAEPETGPADDAPPAEGTAESTAESTAEDTAESTADRSRIPALLRRRGVLVAAGALVVVVAVVVTLVVVLGGSDRPVPPGAMPTLGNQFAAPPTPEEPPEPSEPSTPSTAPVTLPEYPDGPSWTVQPSMAIDDADPPAIAVTAGGYVLAKDGQLWGYNRAGKQTWTAPAPKADYSDMTVTPTTVLVSYDNPNDDRWPQPKVIIARDTATGKERWRETEASFWSATTDTVYMSVCYGGQNNHIGDCQLSARDPQTNAVRWSVPTYASSSVTNVGGFAALPTPPYLVIGGYPTGADTYAISTHEPSTGALLGRGYDGPDGHSLPVDDTSTRTLVSVQDRDDNPADGCNVTYTGYALRGATQTWSLKGRVAKRDDGRDCDVASVSINDGRLAITTGKGKPAVVNVDTGAIEWTAPANGTGFAASDTMLLALETTPEREQELVAYRIGTAEPLWRAPWASGSEATATFTANSVTVRDYGAYGYDLKTGDPWQYGDSVEEMPGNLFTACAPDGCHGYRIK